MTTEHINDAEDFSQISTELKLALRTKNHKKIEDIYSMLRKMYYKTMFCGDNAYECGQLAGIIIMLEELLISDRYLAQTMYEHAREKHSESLPMISAVLYYVRRNPGVPKRMVDKTFHPTDGVYNFLVNAGLMSLSRPGKEPYFYITPCGEEYLKEDWFIDTFEK